MCDEFNPFSSVGMASEGEAFVGREVLVKRLVRQTVGKSAVLLSACFGIPRIGKTSLMLKLMKECSRESGDKCIPIYVDVENFLKPGKSVVLWRSICADLAGALGIVKTFAPVDINAAISDFKFLVKEVQKQDRYVLLVMDEFCTCLKMEAQESNEFINTFRSLFGGGLSSLGLSQSVRCRVVSRRSPDYIESQTGGSTLKGLFATNVIRLPLFCKEEFVELCNQLPNKLGVADVEKLYGWTGGHPYIAAMILNVLREREIDGERISLDVALRLARGDIENYFDNLRSLAQEVRDEKALVIPNTIELYNEYFAKGGNAADSSSSEIEECLDDGVITCNEQDVGTNDAQLSDDNPRGKLAWDRFVREKNELLANVRRGGRDTILLTGERGVGKTFFVNEISKAMGGNVKVIKVVASKLNTKENAEDDFWGHVKDAFTGVKDRKGVFEAANGGILFIDEVAKMPLEIQQMLLDVIKSKQVQRRGDDADGKATPVDFLLVCAAWEDLSSMSAKSLFSRDLLDRLYERGGPIEIPPLRDCRKYVSGNQMKKLLDDVSKAKYPSKNYRVRYEDSALEYFLHFIQCTKYEFKQSEALAGNWRTLETLVRRMLEYAVERANVTDESGEKLISICVSDVKKSIVNVIGQEALPQEKNPDQLFELVCKESSIVGVSEAEKNAFIKFAELVLSDPDNFSAAKRGREIYEALEPGKMQGGEYDYTQPIRRLLKNVFKFEKGIPDAERWVREHGEVGRCE